MSVEYHYPDKQELLSAIRHEFQFLVAELGFVEPRQRPEQYPNPYSVLYRKAPVELIVEGINYGGGVDIEFRIREEGDEEPKDRFSIYWLTQMRRPDLLDPAFPNKRGQLLQLPKLVHTLRLVAVDLLGGDLSVLPDIRNAIRKAQIEGEQHSAMTEFLRAEARSQEAFRAQDYASVVSTLGPFRDFLNPSSRKRLEIAQHRLAL